MESPRNGDIVLYVASPPIERWVTTRHADLYYEFNPTSGVFIPSTIGVGVTGVRDWVFGSVRRPMIVMRPRIAESLDGHIAIIEAMSWRGTPYNFGHLARIVFKLLFKREDVMYQEMLEDVLGVTETPSPLVCSEFAAMAWEAAGIRIYQLYVPRQYVTPDHILVHESNDIIAVYDQDGQELDIAVGERWREEAKEKAYKYAMESTHYT